MKGNCSPKLTKLIALSLYNNICHVISVYKFAVSISSSQVGSYFSLLEQKNYALAGDVAHEVLGSLRTVQAFGGESREQAR